MKKKLAIGIGALLVVILIVSKALLHKCYHSDLQDDNKAVCDSITDKKSEEEEDYYCDIYDDDSTAVPSFVKNLRKDFSWSLDTLCVTKNKVFFSAFCETTYAIFDDEKVWIEDPTLRVDSFASGCKDKLYISVVDKSMLIDFSNKHSVRRLKSLAKELPSFTRFRKDTLATYGHSVLFSLTADYPQKNVPHAKEISRWLVDDITSTLLVNEKKYKGDLYNHQQIIDFVTDSYFHNVNMDYGPGKEGYPFSISNIMDLRAKVMNERFVTYQRYTNDYEGGAHGYYTEKLISYDHVHKQEIDFDYLFKAGSKKELLKILLEVAKDHHQYDDYNADIEEFAYITDNDLNRTGELRFPQPGLSEKGIVFSFQPYDISCFAEGTFHYTIPYEKVLHLLTPKGKWCVGKAVRD